MAVKSQHSRVFAELMAVHRQQLVDALIAGTIAYSPQEIIAKIRGFDEASDLSEEADRKLSGDE